VRKYQFRKHVKGKQIARIRMEIKYDGEKTHKG
jgi:hypothetical protein